MNTHYQVMRVRRMKTRRRSSNVCNDHICVLLIEGNMTSKKDDSLNNLKHKGSYSKRKNKIKDQSETLK